MEKPIFSTDNESENEVSFAEMFFRYLSEWKVFVISMAICMGIAVTYLLLSVPKYKVFSVILIDDEKKGTAKQDVMMAFNDLGFFQQNNNLDNEIEILRSKTLMSKVVDSLHLDVAYFKNKRGKKFEIYNNTPLFVSVKNCPHPVDLTINITADNTLSVTGDGFKQEIEFEKELVTPFGLITITQNPYGIETCPITAEIRPGVLPKVTINPVNKTSSVVEISTITKNKEKGKDIINTLVGIYNDNAITEKNYVTSNTIGYIDNQLRMISSELNDAEKNVENYRKGENVMDLQAQGQLLLTSTADYIDRINVANTQLLILQKTKSFITNSNKTKSIIPSNDGLTDLTVLGLIKTYNEEIFNKEKQTVGMKDDFPFVKKFDERISVLRENLLQGINNSISSIELTLHELRRQEGLYRIQASTLPSKEKESRGLLRQQNSKEFIVNYLSQKREEAGLMLALATPNARIIDAAKSSEQPVEPVKSATILAALIAGVVIFIVIIYIKDIFHNEIRSQEDVQKIIKAPFLGNVPISKSEESIPAMNLHSSIAEKFRLIASNTEFIVNNKDTKVLSVTSFIPSEGKSFVARNFAYSLASIGKKVMLLDIDLRKSVVKNTLEIQQSIGTTMFLADTSVRLNEVINTGKYHKNMDIIAVKVYPPNPTELLYSDRMAQLFSELRELQYDYIIVDTAPISLVSDAFITNKFCDATVFVLRHNYTKKSFLEEIQNVYRDNKLNNLVWVMNSLPEFERYGYGYQHSTYGYYDNDKKQSGVFACCRALFKGFTKNHQGDKSK